MDTDQSDIFVHYDDIYKAGVNKELLKRAKLGFIFRFYFI
jgi:cold shock CspA family protein